MCSYVARAAPGQSELWRMRAPATRATTRAGPPPPAITGVNPPSGPVGSSVIITGTNFGPSQGSSTVSFNGTLAAAASSWNGTSITVLVPAGATTGNVVVTVGGMASHGSNLDRKSVV